MIASPILQVPHGFTTREGGVSEGPYASLNLSLGTADERSKVFENQRRVLEQFGSPPVALLHQVHGNTVQVVNAPGEYEGDGLLTQTPGLLLRVGVADCYPVLLQDPVRRVVGALHAGWRGTVLGILSKALGLMQERFSTRPSDVRVAVGPGISGAKFQVGPEVVGQFRAAGFAADRPDPTQEGKYLLDLEATLRQQAINAGVLPEHYWALGICTYSDPHFFSHRRDGGITGRMWGVIQLPA